METVTRFVDSQSGSLSVASTPSADAARTLTATALSSILITFAATVGLGVSSAAPTWRDASWALWLLSGIYLIVQALISFGCGGYVAGGSDGFRGIELGLVGDTANKQAHWEVGIYDNRFLKEHGVWKVREMPRLAAWASSS